LAKEYGDETMFENRSVATAVEPIVETVETIDALAAAVERYWGYSSFRPLQQEAMLAVTAARDSLLVLPTGGGKSLCYQAPALLSERLTVVVSPLISLMKDQVDDLIAAGAPAAAMNSSLAPDQHRRTTVAVREGRIKLLFVSPERLMTFSFQDLLRASNVGAFAIDEAHCISHWGHDFRPEYRRLAELRAIFPEASLHGYTATATERVRLDIADQLGLRDPLVLVGSFDRPNLSYRVLPRENELQQISEIVERHKGEAGIVYCIRRSDVEAITTALQSRGCDARRYHAGLDHAERTATQDAFANETCNLIVATVAFGMGIDRSNIRFVVHAAMPKSIEHYQQETGRAGRDGLEAECTLLYSAGDTPLWKSIIKSSSADADPEFLAATARHIDDMDRYCASSVCRHRALVQYFGQEYDSPSCGACDVCLGDTEPIAESLVIAQKILSCVARVKESFGVAHVVSILHGEQTPKVVQRNHDQLSTFGLLSESDPKTIRNWIWQLVAQGCLRQEGTPYPLLRLTGDARRVFAGELVPRLLQPLRAPVRRRASAEKLSWEGVDRDLFEELRTWRREEALRRGVPPFVLLSDRTLRGIASRRPSSLSQLHHVSGIGETKLAQFGDPIVRIVRDHAERSGATMDNDLPLELAKPAARPSEKKQTAFAMFQRKANLDDVAAAIQRAHGTVVEYLCEFIRNETVADVSPWIAPDVYEKISATIDHFGELARLKPIYDALEGAVPYDEIRIVATHRETRAG
jgi:ATP-dependent DNA helicase RecQ